MSVLASSFAEQLEMGAEIILSWLVASIDEAMAGTVVNNPCCIYLEPYYLDTIFDHQKEDIWYNHPDYKINALLVE